MILTFQLMAKVFIVRYIKIGIINFSLYKIYKWVKIQDKLNLKTLVTQNNNYSAILWHFHK
jgi:hypothetical protein